jgi:hypothetical protein
MYIQLSFSYICDGHVQVRNLPLCRRLYRGYVLLVCVSKSEKYHMKAATTVYGKSNHSMYCVLLSKLF